MSMYHHPASKYQRRPKTDDIVIHCSDTEPNFNGGAAEIRGWHIKERGWLDIGYHFVIRRDGTLELGRPVWAMAAGVEGWNAQSIHVCMVGGRKAGSSNTGKPLPDDNFTPEQWRTLRALVQTLAETDAGSERVLGHRDYPGVDKYCPSFDVKAWWAKQQ